MAQILTGDWADGKQVSVGGEWWVRWRRGERTTENCRGKGWVSM